ncbi:hypothetical protein D3C76_656000 [compost metagenome]
MMVPIGMPEVSPRKAAAMISARNGCNLNLVIRTISPITVTTASSSRNVSWDMPNIRGVSWLLLLLKRVNQKS